MLRSMMMGALFVFHLCYWNLGFAEESHCQTQRCVAVVDAGSTGSRVRFFSYSLDKTNSPVNIQMFWSHDISPGLATLSAKGPVISTYLTQLFDSAPNESLSVYFYSTAGMRYVSSPKQKQIYQLIQNWFDEKSQWKLAQARTINGQEEGLYAWLGANYALGRLQSEHEPLVGVMDFGGASVQIAYPIQHEENFPPHDEFKVNLYGRSFNIYSKSYLGLGQTEVLHQFTDEPKCFLAGYQLPSGNISAGDFEKCNQDVTKLINDVHQVSRGMTQQLRSNPVPAWTVMGGLSYFIKDPLLNFNSESVSLSKIMEKTQGICQESWSSLQSKDPSNAYSYNYCFAGAYYLALMQNGYGLKETDTVNILPKNSNNADWSLGVVLSLDNKAS